MSVLVVDDNPGFRRELVNIINQLSFVKMAQGTGASDLSMIASVLLSARNTVAIVDYDSCRRVCADLEGWVRRLTARLDRAHNVHLVVVAKTSDELLAVRVMKNGASDYYPKRLLSPNVIARCLRQLLPREMPEQPAAAAVDSQADGEAPRVAINGYDIVRKLYESREASIYLARSRSLSIDVVLKVAPFVTNSGLSLARFHREYETFQLINNPSVARVFDHGSTSEVAYIALEHFPLGSLRDRLNSPTSTDDAVEYVRQIAVALREIHSRRIVHRDLKPSNIMLRNNNTLALIDFGIVKSLGESTCLTRYGELRGSPYYMSPEQATGQEVDQRSDLYSLGVIFFEMLTGTKPYTGTDIMDILRQHIEGSPPPLRTEHAPYRPVIDALMAKNPDARPASADELLDDGLFGYAGLATTFARPRRA